MNTWLEYLIVPSECMRIEPTAKQSRMESPDRYSETQVNDVLCLRLIAQLRIAY